jgi:hypothetical protein
MVGGMSARQLQGIFDNFRFCSSILNFRKGTDVTIDSRYMKLSPKNPQ